MIRLGLLFLLITTLSACATMSEQECLSGDWQAVGFEDGSKGRVLSRIEKHANACGNHGINPDLSQYRIGRDQGLKQYCTVSNGFYVGSRGGEYKGVCPEELDDGFVAAFEDGHYLHQLESDLRSIDSETHSINKRIDKLEHRQASIETELLEDTTDRPRRVELLAESKDLAEEIGYLRSQLIGLYQDRGAAQERLANYQAQLSYHQF